MRAQNRRGITVSSDAFSSRAQWWWENRLLARSRGGCAKHNFICIDELADARQRSPRGEQSPVKSSAIKEAARLRKCTTLSVEKWHESRKFRERHELSWDRNLPLVTTADFSSFTGWIRAADAAADEAMSPGGDNSFATIVSDPTKTYVSRVVRASARTRETCDLRSRARELVKQILSFTWTCVLPRVISSGKRARGLPHVSPGCNSPKTPRGRLGALGGSLALYPRGVAVQDDGGMLPTVVGYLYITNERPCEIASLHDDTPSLPRANLSLVYAYVRRRRTSI